LLILTNGSFGLKDFGFHPQKEAGIRESWEPPR